MNNEPVHIEADALIKDMAERKPWSLSRFNDGEWFAILGLGIPQFHTYRNCDGHDYIPEMCNELGECLRNQLGYMYARGGRKHMAAQDVWLEDNGVELPWVHSDVFKKPNNNGELKPLLDQMRKMNCLFVGPPNVAAFHKRLRIPDAGEVCIPQKNCYDEIDDIVHEIGRQIDKYDAQVVSFSASMATNCMIHRLYPEYGNRTWLIDFGAMWDIYAGIKSRSVFRNEDWTARLAKNLA